MKQSTPYKDEEKMLRLKYKDIDKKIAHMYDDKRMEYKHIAEILCVRIDTIRLIHNKYIDKKIEQYKLEKNKKSVDKKIDTES